MSKASEWAAQRKSIAAAKPQEYIAPSTDSDERKCYGGVTDDGACRICLANGLLGQVLAPDIALALARWILETFAEAPDA